MKVEYLEKIYAGWLAKIIGIRLGAPIEGWTYQKIKNIYGELDYYPIDYKEFAADDDSNGPLFFLRALEDSQTGFDITAQDIGDALLNYASFEHGFFWWGGYGVSTEHTAYLNLRAGIGAPRSGSIKQNGYTVAEQIGGQIFIDSWGLVTPGNPDLAAKYAGMAASVTHDGNAIYGGIFIAACISYAFVEQNIKAIIEKGLSYIPCDCEYTRVVRAVIAYYDAHPGSHWRDCFQYIFEHFGYDKYPGACHIIPNSAVMILSLLYGEGDFSDTLNICNMCGWDTDCNVGNIATIMGVRCGLDAIDYHKWRRPINDFLACSSVIGSLNIMDIPYGASYIAKLAWAISGEPLPQPWDEIISRRIDSCHFEYPGSTHAMRLRLANPSVKPEFELINTDESAHSGSRSLKALVKKMRPGDRMYLYKKTYYKPQDFHDSRYDPSFSPLVYPGQMIHGSVYLPEYSHDCTVRLYARNASCDELIEGDSVALKKGEWTTLSFRIPRIEAGLIDEVGFAFDVHGTMQRFTDFVALIDDFYFDGIPDYTIDASKLELEIWNGIHKEVSQFTRLKGLLYLQDGKLNLSCSDFGEAYTGRHDWEDYTAAFTLTPVTGSDHMVNVRVQGGIRSYAAGLTAGGKLGLYKNENGYRKLSETDFPWEEGKQYILSVTVKGNTIKVSANGCAPIVFTDENNPYLTGSIGISVKNGSHCSYSGIDVRPCGS